MVNSPDASNPPQPSSRLQKSLCVLMILSPGSLDGHIHSGSGGVWPCNTEHLDLSMASSQRDGIEEDAIMSSEHELQYKKKKSGFLKKCLF